MLDDHPTPALAGWFDFSLAEQNRGVKPHIARDSGQHRVIDGPAFSMRLQSHSCEVCVDEETVTAVVGVARDESMKALDVAEVARLAREEAADTNMCRMRGRFAIVQIDLRKGRATLLTDRLAVIPLCFAINGSSISFSDRADAVSRAREVDPQAIFNYVYFHVIPAPRTVFRAVKRMTAAAMLTFDADGSRILSTWQPTFSEGRNFSPRHERERFRGVLLKAVEREVTTECIGAFLSGGTDSSTVVGMLGRVTGQPPTCFSIGFDASGYDEMSYARLAAQHFHAQHHEHYITPDDLIRAIPAIAAYYDQPFGNSSALPAYYCAKLAHEHGVDKLLAGDGGDELFGGNTRYARQKLFDAYDTLPRSLRQHVIEPVLLAQTAVHRLPGISKVASYVEQARLPMPERLQSYNLLRRFGTAAVFTRGFLESVSAVEPTNLQREVYQNGTADSIVDRMLAYDWRFTLTDSDLPKVRLTGQLAGEAVGFPLLDDELVDFSLTLPASMKVRRLTLRYFFKEALRDFLPEEIIRKKKHGFGLPFGPWLIKNVALAQFARAALERLTERGFIRRELVHDLFSTRLLEHAGFYGEMVWILMMLEHWLEHHAPTYRLA